MSQLTQFQRSLQLGEIYPKNPNAQLSALPPRLRLLNWNIERGYAPEQLLAYIREVNPDILCLQELDWGNQRTKELDVTDYLARELGLVGYFGIEFFELDTPEQGPALAGGGVHGNAILTRFAPRAVYRVELPPLFDWEQLPAGLPPAVTRQRRLGARFALCADFQLGDRTVSIASVHLENNGIGVDGRAAQLTHLAGALAARQQPGDAAIIAGDLNTLEAWPVRLLGRARAPVSARKPWYLAESRWLQRTVLPELGYIDPFSYRDWTYQAFGIYREKLDWILLKGATAAAQGRGDFNSSDHRPLWADLLL